MVVVLASSNLESHQVSVIEMNVGIKRMRHQEIVATHLNEVGKGVYTMDIAAGTVQFGYLAGRTYM